MTDTTTAPGDTEAAAVAALALTAYGTVPMELAEIDGFTVAFTKQTDSAGRVTVQHERFVPTDAHGNLLEAPKRIAQAVTIETQASLVDYVRDFKRPGTRLFASISQNVIVAVLDFHEGRTTATTDMRAEAGAPPLTSPDAQHDVYGTADFGQHVATLALPFSEEWTAWGAADGKMTDPKDFARFIQENAPDVTDPDAATLLEVVRDIRGIRQVKFTGKVDLNSNNDSFEYEDKSTVNGPTDQLTIPDAFKISIPVYFGGEKVTLQAQLRHEVSPEGRLSLGLKLLRRESVRQATFQQLVLDVAENAGVPVVYGKRG